MLGFGIRVEHGFAVELSKIRVKVRVWVGLGNMIGIVVCVVWCGVWSWAFVGDLD